LKINNIKLLKRHTTKTIKTANHNEVQPNKNTEITKDSKQAIASITPKGQQKRSDSQKIAKHIKSEAKEQRMQLKQRGDDKYRKQP